MTVTKEELLAEVDKEMQLAEQTCIDLRNEIYAIRKRMRDLNSHYQSLRKQRATIEKTFS